MRELGTLLNLGLGEVAHAQPRVLICGDADFSYARALADSVGAAAHITATSYEPELELFQRYPSAPDAVERLRSGGVHVGHGVDARQLAQHFEAETWERIVFNLPQSPPTPRQRNQIQRHRALLRDFCASAASVLSPRGQIWITLLSGQGGTPLDPVQRVKGDTWQIQHEASRAGLLVTSVTPADLEGLQACGYNPTGRGYRGKGSLGPHRQSQGLVVHVLEREVDRELDKEIRGVSQLEWAFDNSFWVDGPVLDEAALLSVARDAIGQIAAHALNAPPELLDEYTNEEGRDSRTYRFFYASDTIALSRERTLQLNAKVCEALAKGGGAVPRHPSAEACAAVREAGDIPSKVGVSESADGLAPDGSAPGDSAPGDSAPGDSAPGDSAPNDSPEDHGAAGATGADTRAPPSCGGRWRQP